MGKNTVWTEYKVNKLLREAEEKFNKMLTEDVHHAYVDGFKNGELFSRTRSIHTFLGDFNHTLQDLAYANERVAKREERLLDPDDSYGIDEYIDELEKYGLEIEEHDHYIDVWNGMINKYMELEKERLNGKSNECN